MRNCVIKLSFLENVLIPASSTSVAMARVDLSNVHGESHDDELRTSLRCVAALGGAGWY